MKPAQRAHPGSDIAAMHDPRIQGESALLLALLDVTARSNREQASKPVAEIQKHFDDLWAKYGEPEKADWGGSAGWALHWAVKDAESLQAAGQPVPDINAWRQRVYDVMHSTDTLFQRDAWRALRSDPSLIPSAQSLQEAKADPQAYEALRTRVWAAAQIINPMRMGEVLNFDADTRDLGPGLWKTYFDDRKGRALQKEIKASLQVVGDFTWSGPAARDAMAETQTSWSAKTRTQDAAATAKTGAKTYAAASDARAQTSRTGGQTPASVAIRLKS